MEYSILLHDGLKPHFIIDKCSKELVKRDLISRDFPFIKEIKFTINFKIDDGLLLNFNTIKHNDINLSINNKLKYIKIHPLSII